MPTATIPKSTDRMRRILIADDSQATRYALRRLIQGHGWEVCGEAEDGLAAVERTAILKPDLVILDLRMPNLDGLQAGQAIHTADRNIALLLFTLDCMDRRLQGLARRAGFRGALAKSEGIFALSEAIEGLLQGKTFFLSASESRSAVTSQKSSIGATEKARRTLKPRREPEA
jgi:DNA-binding NarL/FixJ family response regulator